MLRDYQQEAETDIYSAWNAGAQNVMGVMPTGSGKTVLFGKIIKDNQGATCAIAHRQELVGQISLALARYGVKHRIIAPQKVVKFAITQHMRELGRNYYSPTAVVGVAGVDTLINAKRIAEHYEWIRRVSLWVQDEAHHLLRKNKWGKAADLFPDARGLGVTATPVRADGHGLGRHADGVFDTMITGPTMRDLINRGYLTDYRIFAPLSDAKLNTVDVSKTTGDYNKHQLIQVVKDSHIVGDVVDHYKKHALGKLGITFATDVETATNIAAKFNVSGIPAEVVSAKTLDRARVEILRRFKNREILQLVNVDLFGEGFDLPAIEVVSMARPTQSYSLYVQQFGRALRILDGKIEAMIIDHVGNVERHGLPDKIQNWSLDRRERAARNVEDDNVIPVRACPECTAIYERIYKACPHCGHVIVPAERSAPEFVDGDLHELDPETLAAMRGEIERIDGPADFSPHWTGIAAAGARKHHRVRQEMQSALRESIAWWAGYQQQFGRGESESYRLFYLTFGVDVLTAQTLGKADALKLANRINLQLGKLNNERSVNGGY